MASRNYSADGDASPQPSTSGTARAAEPSTSGAARGSQPIPPDDDEVELRRFVEENPNLVRLQFGEIDGELVPLTPPRDPAPPRMTPEIPVIKEENIKYQRTKHGKTKETFECTICEIVFHSRDTMEVHARGRQHRENERENETKGGIYQIPNPEPLRKKIPIRLQIKLMESTNPLVGLEYIIEFLPISSDEVEPYYECFLCDNSGEAHTMAVHIMSANHIRKYLLARFPEDGAAITRYTNAELFDLAERFCLRYNLNIIKTIESDLLYRWPIGKSPWCVEQGGDGVAPTGARERVVAGERRVPLWDEVDEYKRGVRKFIPTLKILSPNSIGQFQKPEHPLKAVSFLIDLEKKLNDFAMDIAAKTDQDTTKLEEKHQRLKISLLTLKLKMALKHKAGVLPKPRAAVASADGRDDSRSPDRHRSRKGHRVKRESDDRRRKNNDDF